MRVEREYRGVPCWLVREYLGKLGAIESGQERMQGDGWSAVCRESGSSTFGPVRVKTIRVEFEGDEKTLAAVLAQFDLRMLRGGG